MLENLIKKCNIKDLKIYERIKVYEASYTFDIKDAPNSNYFYNIINSISNRDAVKINLTIDNLEFCEIKSKEDVIEKYDDFISSCIDEDDIIYVTIEIKKSIESNHFSIYAFDKFVDDILSISINEIMHSFSMLFKNVENRIIFDVFNDISMFATKTMIFVPYKHNNTIENYIDRKQRIKDCKDTASFYNFDVYEVIPDDFKIITNYEDNKLSQIFNKITTILSIVFIASSASIEKNSIHFTINGQRLLESSFEFNDISANEELYKIYDWIYKEGNHIDKALLAHNAISLHCKSVSLMEIDNKVMYSIKSNYELYLKENLKEYLELKNKISEFISDTISRTGEYVYALFEKFKVNLVAIFAFIFSTILANIVSSQPVDNIFNKEITVLLDVILIVSLVYGIICYKQFEYEVKEVYDSYEKLRENYKDILDEKDLEEIFKNDSAIKRKKEYINKKQKQYLFFWISFLFICILLLEFILSSEPMHKYILNLIKNIICHIK